MSADTHLVLVDGDKTTIMLNPMGYPRQWMSSVSWGTLRVSPIHQKAGKDWWAVKVEVVHGPTSEYRPIANIAYRSLSPEEWAHVEQLAQDLVLLRYSL